MQDGLKLISEKPPALPSLVEIKAERDVKLAADRNGALWSAQQNAYLLKRYSRQGAVEESVAVNGGRVQWKERTEEDWKALDKIFGRTVNRSQKMAAVRVVRGLAAQANRVYQVVETPEGVALDRWDDDSQVLERLLLEGGQVISASRLAAMASTLPPVGLETRSGASTGNGSKRPSGRRCPRPLPNARGGGDEAGAQAVAAKLPRIVAGLGGAGLDDLGDAAIGEARAVAAVHERGETAATRAAATSERRRPPDECSYG